VSDRNKTAAVRMSLPESFVKDTIYCVQLVWLTSGHYMYRQFNIHKSQVLPTQCIYVFCVDLRKNSDYFPIQH